MREVNSKIDCHNSREMTLKGDGMIKIMKKSFAAITVLSIMTCGLILAGCGSSGGGLSSQVVSGNASVGAPLIGKVTLKDSSSTPLVRTTDTGDDGSFAIDVTGMQAPFILEATGNAAGTDHTLHSFANGTGTANVNPLSDAIVASAAGDDDASESYNHSDHDKLHRISSNLQATVNTLLGKIQHLLIQYNVQNTNPITAHYISNHIGMDDMFDHVKITVNKGILTIINTKNGATIFTGSLSDIASGVFTDGNLPTPPAVPVVPTGLTATGGTGQVSLAWAAVSNATSYTIYYATTSGVTTANGTKIPTANTSFVQTGLTAATTYYYIVTALNSTGESVASTQVSAATASAPPVSTVPVTPTGVSAVGGTKQATIKWTTVSGATSYNLYWSKTPGVTTATGTKIAGATSPAVQTGLTDGTAYYYIVTAVNSTGESAASGQVTATTLSTVPAPTVPAIPTGVSATGGTNQVTLVWSTVTGATSYNMYYATSTGVTKTNGTKVSNATTPYIQTGLAAGTTYYFIVTAVNSVGEGAASAQITATTTTPAVLDGLALYNANCVSCHGTAKLGKSATAIQGAIAANTGGMSSLSTLTTAQIAAIATTTATTPPSPACGSCHAIPPATGHHAFHISQGYTCTTCHGTGYSSTTVNAATHNNGVVNVATTPGWNAASGSCSNSCHGTKTW
jgi:mono/diheme cytochrome c family protein